MKEAKMKIKYGVLLEVTNKDIKNGNFVIPVSVTIIGNDAFSGCESFLLKQMFRA